MWCMDNLTLAVRAVVVSPFGLTGWLVLWANRCFDFAVLPHTPQANGTPKGIKPRVTQGVARRLRNSLNKAGLSWSCSENSKECRVHRRRVWLP